MNPPAPKPPGFHSATREAKREHFSSLSTSNSTKIPREDPPERERMKIVAGEGKNAKFWTLRAPNPSGPTLQASTPSGPAPPQRTPTTPPKNKNWPNAVTAKCGQRRMAKSGLAKCGHGQILGVPAEEGSSGGRSSGVSSSGWGSSRGRSSGGGSRVWGFWVLG